MKLLWADCSNNWEKTDKKKSSVGMEVPVHMGETTKLETLMNETL